jgi:2-polyprenyl-6-methoxyphenol hydroxylase-like FAD-dependent oxidoreductase
MKNSNHTPIAIIGAGVGGLTLANGLKQKGVEVTIFEKDITPVTKGPGIPAHHQ